VCRRETKKTPETHTSIRRPKPLVNQKEKRIWTLGQRKRGSEKKTRGKRQPQDPEESRKREQTRNRVSPDRKNHRKKTREREKSRGGWWLDTGRTQLLQTKGKHRKNMKGLGSSGRGKGICRRQYSHNNRRNGEKQVLNRNGSKLKVQLNQK